jgi:hypothetical protein
VSPSGARRLGRRFLGAAAALLAASPAGAQSLGDLVGKTNADTTVAVAGVAETAPWYVLTGEVVAGGALAAAAGYGVGLLAEKTGLCDDCDAGEPGGDTAGIVFGVPAGALVGVYLVGSLAPPSGKVMDTLLGAAIGAAVFAGYVELLEGKGDALRWAGVTLPAGMAAVGFNKSREAMMRAAPQTSSRLIGDPGFEVTLVRFDFD